MDSIKNTNHSTPLPHREGQGESLQGSLAPLPIIAIVAGGDTSEYQVSLRSAQGIYSFIDKEKYTLYIVVMHGNDWHVQLTDGTELPEDMTQLIERWRRWTQQTLPLTPPCEGGE